MEETGGGPLPPGKRGLLVSQLRLEGVVRQSGDKPMIAVVTNRTNRAYFLRENDEVYNGVVSKITPDSIYFTEKVRTADGQTGTREVVKRLGSGPGENR
jgi:dUTPase